MTVSPTSEIDPALKQWATERQAAVIDAVNQHGSHRAAAKALGVSHSAVDHSIRGVKIKAARAGYAPGHFADGTAPGYRMGKVTIQRGPNGVERVWERQHPADLENNIREMVATLVESARGLAKPIPAPKINNDNLLACYVFGDPHYGMRSWAAETGEDYDLEIAERLTEAAIDRLCASAPPAAKGLLIQAGDFFHADNNTNMTPASGAILDVDTRHAKVMQIGLKSMIRTIQRMLERHAEVEAWMMPGNHDPHSSFALALALDAYFSREPRVKIDLSPSLYRYTRHGKTLIGAHHGHGAKQQDLPLIMAVDRPEDWGASVWRFVWMGHVHHDSVKEVQGVRVESVRTLAAKDAWHAGKGYRSMRDSRVVIYHAEAGEIERHTCAAAVL